MTRHAHWLVDALLLGLTVDLVIVALLGALFALVGMVLAFDGWVIGGSALSVVAFLAANMAATWRQRRRRHDGEPGGEEQYDASRHDQRGGLPARNGAGSEQAGHGSGGEQKQSMHRSEASIAAEGKPSGSAPAAMTKLLGQASGACKPVNRDSPAGRYAHAGLGYYLLLLLAVGRAALDMRRRRSSASACSSSRCAGWAIPATPIRPESCPSASSA